MSAKWDEMFGVKEEIVVDEVKVKKQRKKTVGKQPIARNKKVVKKSAEKKIVSKKGTSNKAKPAGKKATRKVVEKKAGKTKRVTKK